MWINIFINIRFVVIYIIVVTECVVFAGGVRVHAERAWMVD